MQNHTDIVITPERVGVPNYQAPYYPNKIELDDPLDRNARMRQGFTYWIALPDNPVTLVLDTLTWVNASALTLLAASVWAPVAILWAIWALTLIVVTALPGLQVPLSTRVCASIRLVLMCLGALALLL